MIPDGYEIILGAKRDPSFGPTLMFGLGGIYVGLFKDVTFGLAPIDQVTAVRMVHQVKAYRLLEGARGGVDGRGEPVPAPAVVVGPDAHLDGVVLVTLVQQPAPARAQHRGIGGVDDVADARATLVGPGRAPLSRSARRTHFRKVSAVQPIFAAIEISAAHCDA